MKTLATVMIGVSLLVLTFGASRVSAQCPASGGGTILNPSVLRADLPEHAATLPDDSPAVTGYLLGWMAEGASEPTQTAAVAKAAFALVTGTTSCYDAAVPALSGVPIGQRYIAVLRALRASDSTQSAWSAPSNPFALTQAPAVPGGVELRRP